MEPMAMHDWIEIWVLSILPIFFYLGVVYHAYALYRKFPMRQDVHWRWSFIWIQLAIVGTMIVRMRSLVLLWSAGRAGAWAVVDPELLAAAWCIGIGLLAHVYLLDKHPVWQTAGPRLTRPPEEGR